MKKAILRRRDVPEDSLIGDVGTGGIGHGIECSQNPVPVDGDLKQALPLAAGFRANEIG